MNRERLDTSLNLLALLGVSGVLLIAFYFQLILHELPCPLCLLQRGCFVAVAIGFMLNLRFGTSPRHYGLVVLAAVLGAATSARQVLLHIVPGSGSYGSALFGLHFYTWAFIGFVAVIVYTACLLLTRVKGDAPTRGHPVAGALAIVVWMAMGLFVLIVLGNLASTLLECGFGHCADNPVGYLWLGQ